MRPCGRRRPRDVPPIPGWLRLLPREVEAAVPPGPPRRNRVGIVGVYIPAFALNVRFTSSHAEIHFFRLLETGLQTARMCLPSGLLCPCAPAVLLLHNVATLPHWCNF